ncbi:MAG: MFS transporter [Acidimicrobiia bacterium]|nr:MFS transporter [Acidimicrobiia bacterium]
MASGIDTTSTAGAAPAHGKTPGTARAALSYRNFRIIFIGLTLSQIGTWMQNFTLPAYIDDRTGRPALVGLMVFAQLGPLLILSVPAGVLADKVSKKKLMLAMQMISAVLTVVLAIIVANDVALWTIFVVQLCIGSANAIQAPAFQSSMPLLVHRQDLPGAISLNSAMINGSRVMGPVLAAVLAVAGLSTAQIFLVNAATYLFFIGALVIVKMPDVRAKFSEKGWRRLLTGTHIVRGRAVLGRLLMGMFLFSLFSLVFIGLFPSVTRLNLDIDPSANTYRWLYAVWGAGAFTGAISVGTWMSRFDRKVMIVWGFIGFSLSLGTFSQLRGPEFAFVVGFVLGFFYFMTATAITTTLQLNLKDTERASVMPLWFMVFGGTVPIGNLLFGVVIEWVGARAVLVFGAVFALFLAWWVDLRRLAPDAFLPEADGGEPGRPA